MAQYLRYELINQEPIRIVDDDVSQLGQSVALRYIPGSTMRGAIVNALIIQKREEWEKNKAFILKNIFFLNAYPVNGEQELIPSLKGFYEDKADTDREKKVENILTGGSDIKGLKRAYLGSFCCIKDSESGLGKCMEFYSVQMGSELKIKMNLEKNEKRNVFRSESIAPGQHFVGYIRFDEKVDAGLQELVQKYLEESRTITLGNAKSAGLGKCEVRSVKETDRIPYQEYGEDRDLEGEAYLAFLSHGAMRDHETGEYCGVALTTLENMLGVSELGIESCSTSTRVAGGYNRVWGGRVPSVPMYEMGSVFRLSFKGTISGKKVKELEEKGIGVRKAEGYGRILFLKDYESIQYKRKGTLQLCREEENCEARDDDRKVIRCAARGYLNHLIDQKIAQYILEHQLDRNRVSNSQLGIVEAIAFEYRYNPAAGIQKLKEHFEHAKEKENSIKIQKEATSVFYFEQALFGEKGIFKTDIKDILGLPEEVMGIKTDELLIVEQEYTDVPGGTEGTRKEELLEAERNRLGLELLSQLIRYEYKKAQRR